MHDLAPSNAPRCLCLSCYCLSVTQYAPPEAGHANAEGSVSYQLPPFPIVDSVAACSQISAAHSVSDATEQHRSPHTPPHSAVPQTDVLSSPPPIIATPPPVMPVTMPSIPHLPLPPLPPAVVLTATTALVPPTTGAITAPISAAHIAQVPPRRPSPPPPPPPPSDPALLLAIDRLAEFVHRNAQFEQVIRSKHPSHAPGMFAFLYDDSCADYQYYQWRRQQLAGVVVGDADEDDEQPGGPAMKRQRSHMPTADLDSDVDGIPLQPSNPSHASLSAMETFINRLSSTDTINQRTHIPDAPSHTNPPHYSHTASSSNGGESYDDYSLPRRFFSHHARQSKQTTRAALTALTKSAQLDDSNIGFRLLAKMGWKGGEGLGPDGRKGRTEPVVAHTGTAGTGGGLGMKEEGNGKGKRKRKGQGKGKAPVRVKSQHEAADGGNDEGNDSDGSGDEHDDESERVDGEEEEGEGEGGFADVYESYKRQMSMKYQHRPNPLNNPRRPY